MPKIPNNKNLSEFIKTIPETPFGNVSNEEKKMEAEKIAEMEAQKARASSGEKNTDEEKEILAVETEYNFKIKEKEDKLNELLKEKEAEKESVNSNTEDEQKRKNQEEIEKLSKTIKRDLTPNDKNIDQTNEKYPIIWGKDGNHGEFKIEIGGKRMYIVIDEEKAEWKESSKFIKFITFGRKNGKWIAYDKPKWEVGIHGSGILKNKYHGFYPFDTKEEAILKANEIIEEGMKIKFEGEKKYMGQEASQEPTPSTPPSQQNQNDPETKTPEPIQNISQEQLLNNLDDLEKKAVEKLDSSKFRGKILKALDKWENFGKGEGRANFAKRMTKNFINLALVGLVSSFAVDQIANAGIEIAGQTLSNTALAGGTSHYLINKVGVGLGMSAAMDRLGNKVPGKVRKWMPYVMGGGSVLAAGLLSGGTVAVAAGAGIFASKLLVNRYTNEKIESREKKAREELLEKIKKEGQEINTEKVKAFENEYNKLLKKYENQRIWGKLRGTIARFGLATVISTVTLEASGYAKDLQAGHHANTGQTETEAKPVESEDSTPKNDSIPEKQAGEIKSDSTETKISTPDTTNIAKESDTITSQNGNTETQAGEAVENKTEVSSSGQNKFEEIKTEFSSKGAIETIKELQAKINTEYPDKVPENLEEFTKSDPTQMAIKLGLYNPEDTSGNESAMLIKGSTLGFDEHGNLSVHDIKTGEDHILIEEKGSADVVEKYDGKMIDSDNSNVNIENANGTPAQVDPETGLLIETNAEGDTIETNHYSGGSENTIDKGVNNDLEIKLTPDVLEQVERISENNIDRVFPTDEAINQWYNIQKTSAMIITHMSTNNADEIYKPLIEYVHNLQRITGITDPYEATLIKPAESISQYIERALEKAASDPKIGLDKVTL